MTALGVPWSWIAAAGVAVAAALLALSLLRPRTQERVVPSIMLWLDDGESARRRVLWHRLARPLSLLAAALAVFSMLLALAEPVWEPPFAAPPKRRVVVAAPGAMKTARKFAARLDPLRTAVIRAEAGGAVVSPLGAPAKLVRDEDVRLAPDWHAVTVLVERLAGTGGEIHVFSAVPPSQLPGNGRWHRAGPPVEPAAPKATAIFPDRVSAAMRRTLSELPGAVVVRNAEDADIVCTPADGPHEVEEHLYATETYMMEPAAQRVVVPSVPPEAPRFRPWRLDVFFAVLALVFAAADLILWQRGKIV